MKLCYYCFTCFLVISFTTTTGNSQSTTLPPAAQEAINKGIVAAKIPDYPLAVTYFQEARKAAPQSAEIFFNLGLAESKIPGRELRAICWFGAYLIVNPDAVNASLVKEQMVKLEVINKSNVSRFLMITQDAARDLSKIDKSKSLNKTIVIWLDYGDMAMAQKAYNLIPSSDIYYKDDALSEIAYVQTRDDDFEGAKETLDNAVTAHFMITGLKTIATYQSIAGDSIGAKRTLNDAFKIADLIQYYPQNVFGGDNESMKVRNFMSIAWEQVELSDMEGAKKTIVKALENTDLIKDVKERAELYCWIARAQAEKKDIKAAMKTMKKALKIAELIPDDSGNSGSVYNDIVDTQAQIGDIEGAQKIIDLMKYKSDAYMRIANAQAKSGDITGAQKMVGFIEEVFDRSMAFNAIVEAQLKIGDIAGAQRTADLIEEKSIKSRTSFYIAIAMAESGDIAGAQKIADLIVVTSYKPSIDLKIAIAQAKIGDIAGAQKTADLINDLYNKSIAYVNIAIILAKSGDLTGAQNALINAQFASDLIETKDMKTWAQKNIGAAEDTIGLFKNEPRKIKTTSTLLKTQTKAEANFAKLSVLLKKLDDKLETDDCALNTKYFFNLDSYLKSLTKTDNASEVYMGLKTAAEKIVKARNIVLQLLEAQSGK